MDRRRGQGFESLRIQVKGKKITIYDKKSYVLSGFPINRPACRQAGFGNDISWYPAACCGAVLSFICSLEPSNP
jgi:hypothetical protein